MKRRTTLTSIIAGLLLAPLLAPLLAAPAAASTPAEATATPGVWHAYLAPQYIGPRLDAGPAPICTAIPPVSSARNGADSGMTVFLYSDGACMNPVATMGPGQERPFIFPPALSYRTA